MSESEVPERWSFEYARMKRHADTRPSFEIGAKILEELGAAEAKLALLPADWQQDSSLQTWFPFTAEELDGVKAKVREQAATHRAIPAGRRTCFSPKDSYVPDRRG